MVVHPKLINITPGKTVLWSLLGEVTIKSLGPFWLQTELDSIDRNNAFADGSDFTYGDERVPVRVENVPMISRKNVKLAGATLEDQHLPAIGQVKKQQLEIAMGSLKRDLNYRLWNSKKVLVGEPEARSTRGIVQSLTGASKVTGGAGATLTETIFKQLLLKPVYDSGFEPTDVVMSDVMRHTVDSFFTDAKPAIINASEHKVISHVKVYDSPWGLVNLHAERPFYLDGGDYDGAGAQYTVAANTGPLFAMERQQWQKFIFRPTRLYEPQPRGDYYEGVLQIDWGLQDLAATSGQLIHNYVTI